MDNETKGQVYLQILMDAGAGLMTDEAQIIVDKLLAVDLMTQEEIDQVVAEQQQVKADEIQSKIDAAQAVIDEFQPQLDKIQTSLKTNLKVSTL